MTAPVDRQRLEAWFRDEEPDTTLVPAATVVVVREAADGIETLLLHRSSKVAFGGAWVFPGGRIDPEDRADAPDGETAARRAAVREAWEEAGLVLDADALAWFAHWTPPVHAPRRFATWFFVSPVSDHTVTIDGGEIHDSAWMAPADALARRDAGGIELVPPTWMCLRYLSRFADVDALMADAHAREPAVYQAVIGRGEVPVIMWDGDAGHRSGDPSTPGPRHRLVMGSGAWALERDAEIRGGL